MIIISLYSIFAAVVGGVAVLRIVLSFKSLCYLFARWWRWPNEIIQVYQHFDVPRYAENSHEENPLYRKAAVYVSSLPTIEDADAACLFSSAAKSNDFSSGWAAGRRLTTRSWGPECSGGSRTTIGSCCACGGGTDAGAAAVPAAGGDGGGGDRPPAQGAAGVHRLRRRGVGVRGGADAPGDDGRGGDGRGGEGAGGGGPRGLPPRPRVLPPPRPRVAPELPPPRAPGTGKSTFAAAMARSLGFDLYDLDLSRGGGGRRSRPQIAPPPHGAPRAHPRGGPRPFLAQRGAAERFSETLNFMDGVVACCGDERVMVFTAASADAIDPAALRPGGSTCKSTSRCATSRGSRPWRIPTSG
uniref:ATPase AAA-type core domain-containing protein n=1 Tax=Ananas comosus var. bracteatus TaxID=296719 RepID=A0A6V7QV39_ANACO